MSYALKTALLATAAIVIPSPAFAYIDPAVGSMLLQGIVGAIAIAGTAWYTFRQKVSEYYATAKSAFSSKNSMQK